MKEKGIMAAIYDIGKRMFNLGKTTPKKVDFLNQVPMWTYFLEKRGEISESNATTISAVWNAIELIAGGISTLPLRLIRRDRTGKTVEMTDNPLFHVLHSRWNPFITANIGRQCLMLHVLLWGNGYAEIVRNRLGKVVELWPITPDRVTPKFENYSLSYDITVSAGNIVNLPSESVLHVKNTSNNGLVGLSVISQARESLGLTKNLERFGSKFFKEGTHPGIIITHPAKLDPETFQNLKRSLQDTYSGLGNAHRLMLLEDGMKPEKISIQPNDAQFLESRTFQIDEIARWFNLPPHKLKELTKSSFSNIESEQISFVIESLLPRIVNLEQTFNAQLLTDEERAIGAYTKHTLEGLLRGDAVSRANFYRILWNMGALSINEIREKEDMDPIEGGNVHYVPLNMVPLGTDVTTMNQGRMSDKMRLVRLKELKEAEEKREKSLKYLK